MKYPREVWAGSHIKNAPQMKRRIVKTKSEYISFVKEFNNRTNVYTSVYDFGAFAETAKIEASVILDRVFLDFDAHDDNLEQALEDLVIVLDYINKHDYLHTMFFSGKGFHLFVYGEVTDDIRNIQAFHRVVKELLPEDSTLDDRVGQTTRLRRVPNTVNLSSSNENGVPYYCIPIFEDDLKSGIQEIKRLASEPRLIARKVTNSSPVKWPNLPSIEMSGEEVKVPKIEGNLPLLPCLHNSVMVENPSHMARAYLVAWYRDLLTQRTRLITEEQKKEVLDRVIDEIERIASIDGVWLDWDKATTRRHAKFTVFGNYKTPNCKTKLIPEGYCVGRCWRYPDYLDEEEK